MEYLNEEELRTEIINIQKSIKMRTLKAEYEEYLRLPMREESKNNMIEYNLLKEQGYIENYSRETYGQMVLKLVEKICLKGSFAGYTYRDDFYSNAIQRVLSYSLTNFNPDMISKRSHQRVKAFAYLTSIINNAVVEIINERKQEQIDLVERLLPLDNLYAEVSKHYKPQLRRAETPKEYPSVILKVQDNNVTQDGEIIGEFKNIYDTIKDYPKDTKIQLEYPEDYLITLEEANEIYSLEFLYLNVHRYEKEKYKPSFPKNEKEVKIDSFLEWE